MAPGVEARAVGAIEIGPDVHFVSAGGLFAGDPLELRDTLLRLTATPGARVVVDLEGVHTRELDAAVLGILSAAAHGTEAGGGELVLIAGDKDVHELLHKTGVSAFARVEWTLAAAVDRLVPQEAA
jgi:anti-anti-sigma regulatory factor